MHGFVSQETRVSLRLLLLRVFGAMCGLDSMVITLLLFSILTTELAEEIQRNLDGRYHKLGCGRVWVSSISKTSADFFF